MGVKDLSFRSRLRAFQAMRGDTLDATFVADLDFLQNRDLDLSVRLGAMLAFNALMITIGTHPVSASPGSPLSLDATRQPVEVIASLLALIPLVVSSFCCLKALLLGEDFDGEGLEDEAALRQRLFATFIASIDKQKRLLGTAIWACEIGVAAVVAMWVWIVIDKLV